MPKNIIICSDGTGNTAVKGRGTNVFKLYEAVDVAGHLSDSSNYEQVAIYDDGVGTQKLKLIRVLAGAFGFGLARNVRQLYAELVRCYSKGDHIYVFGFSRGAFTARTLAGFIDHAGILNPTGLSSQDLNSVVGDLYRAYRKARPAVLERVTTPLTRGFRWLWRKLRPLPGYGFHGERTIKFVGVWDTVDAVGFPIPGIAWIWNHLVHRFKFTGRARPDCVQKACHALAIDEARASFEIFLWQDDPRVEQVWFAGVHSNVGGGYPKQGMSLVALDWMMSHAENESEGSLRFGEGLRAQYHDAINVHDNLYDSRSGPAIYYRYGPRDVAAICSEVGAPVKVHHSAIDRIRKRSRGYAPGNLPDSFEIVGTPGRMESHVRTGPVRLKPTGDRGESWQAPREFSGAAGPWAFWRKTVQVVFYVAQIAIITWAVTSVTAGGLPAPALEDDSAALSARAVVWLQGLAENAVAPIPGNFVQEWLVQPMFANPKIGLSFLLVFPLCYFLGLVGRVRMETINSNRWRHLEIVNHSRSGP